MNIPQPLKYAAASLALSFQAAQAEVFELPEPRRTEVAETIKRMCASSAKPLVIDTFADHSKVVGGAPKQVPQYGSVSHGDLVAAQLGRDYMAYNLKHDIDRGVDYSRTLLGAANAIEAGDIEKPSFIVLSNGYSVDIEDLNEAPSQPNLTPENIHTKRAEALEIIIKFEDIVFPEDANLKDYLEAFDKFNRMGIPVVTSAGNEGEIYKFNMNSLLPGVLTVSSLEMDGTLAKNSNFNSLTDLVRGGTGIRVLPDGMNDPSETEPITGTSFAAPRICQGPEAGF